jgi:hypothetical protein
MIAARRREDPGMTMSPYDEPARTAPPPAAAALAVEPPCDPEHGVILVRVQDYTQLFNSLDPSPFLERDLDDDLVDYIVSWAREIPADKPLRLEIQVRQPSQRSDAAEFLRTAVQNHFSNASVLKRNEFRQLLRRGRLSLAIGLLVLATAMLASELVARAGERPLLNYLREGLIIGGWVAMWRPLEILLYDWWPVRAERRVLERLRDATIHVSVGT